MTTAVCGGAIRSFRYLLHRFQPDPSSDCRSVGAPPRDFVHYTVTGVWASGIPAHQLLRGLLDGRRPLHGPEACPDWSYHMGADQAVPPIDAIGRLR